MLVLSGRGRPSQITNAVLGTRLQVGRPALDDVPIVIRKGTALRPRNGRWADEITRIRRRLLTVEGKPLPEDYEGDKFIRLRGQLFPVEGDGDVRPYFIVVPQVEVAVI